jgi:hypothetical protein
MKVVYYASGSSIYSINKILFFGAPYSIRAPNYTTIGQSVTGDSQMVDSATYRINSFTIGSNSNEGPVAGISSHFASDYIDTANGGFVCSFQPPVLQTSVATKHFCIWHLVDGFGNMHTISFYSGTGAGGTFLPAPSVGSNSYVLGDTFTIASNLQRVVTYETALSGTVTLINDVPNTLTRFVKIILNVYVLPLSTVVQNAPISFSNIRLYQSGQHGATFMTLKQTVTPSGSNTLLTTPTTILARGTQEQDIFVTDQNVDTNISSIIAQFSLSDSFYAVPAAWNVNNSYSFANVVTTSSGSQYWQSRRNQNRQNTPDNTLENWSSSGVSYQVGAVRYYATNNTAYVCAVAHTSSATTPNNEVAGRWTVLQAGNSASNVWAAPPALEIEIVNAQLNNSPRYGFFIAYGNIIQGITNGGGGFIQANGIAGCRYEIITTRSSVILRVTDSGGTSLINYTITSLTQGVYRFRIKASSDNYTVDDIRFYGTAHASQGVTGPSGAQGQQGVTGPSGAQGQQGVTGPSGVEGQRGVTGPSGAQGQQGVTGPSGAQGQQGVTGPSGAQGQQGVTGPSGAQGVTGASGVQGLQGATGPAYIFQVFNL